MKNLATLAEPTMVLRVNPPPPTLIQPLSGIW